MGSQSPSKHHFFTSPAHQVVRLPPGTAQPNPRRRHTGCKPKPKLESSATALHGFPDAASARRASAVTISGDSQSLNWRHQHQPPPLKTMPASASITRESPPSETGSSPKTVASKFVLAIGMEGRTRTSNLALNPTCPSLGPNATCEGVVHPRRADNRCGGEQPGCFALYGYCHGMHREDQRLAPWSGSRPRHRSSQPCGLPSWFVSVPEYGAERTRDGNRSVWVHAEVHMQGSQRSQGRRASIGMGAKWVQRASVPLLLHAEIDALLLRHDITRQLRIPAAEIQRRQPSRAVQHLRPRGPPPRSWGSQATNRNRGRH